MTMTCNTRTSYKDILKANEIKRFRDGVCLFCGERLSKRLIVNGVKMCFTVLKIAKCNIFE